MLFTHHSHSGQFCTHATSALSEVIEAAIARGLTSIALTEHIPRDLKDHYPGEAESAVLQGRDLWSLFDAYYTEAQRLRTLHADRIEVLIGFESEWVRTPRSNEIISQLRAKYAFDLFVGSVHHVHTIPIDYNDEDYARARAVAGGLDEDLAVDYFDAQLEMLRALEPPVVGHFDLIRLKADGPNRDREWREWGEGVWTRIKRNLQFVAGYGGVLEVNSAALRKGLRDVYPSRDIMEEFLRIGGKFTLSDDSHGVDQLCTNYEKALDCIERAGVTTLWYFTTNAKSRGDQDAGSGGIELKAVPLNDVRTRLMASLGKQA